MSQRDWQRLLALESIETVQKLFFKIHQRSLSVHRALEVTSSARQARELFVNAARSDISVRPILAYYGISSLSRSLVLLLSRFEGENSLVSGHGLKAVSWSQRLRGDVSKALENVGSLSIRTGKGLFNDLAERTENRTLIHISSSAVEWRLDYDINLNTEVSLNDLLDRFPDTATSFSHLGRRALYVRVDDLSYTSDKGFSVKVNKEHSSAIIEHYESVGYRSEINGDIALLTAEKKGFEENRASFMHSYHNRMFGTIPILHLVKPLEGQFSEICSLYMISFFLANIARYYPTHWLSLIKGFAGDGLSPILQEALDIVQTTYPTLVAEFIEDAKAKE